jgi:putative tricarboxylic transport membrane protein
MNAFLRKGDFWSGLALAALGAFIVERASHWAYVGDDGPGPAFFPMWYGGVMLVLSLLLVAGAVLKRGAGGAELRWSELRRALLCWVAFAVCIALLKPLGFMLAFALLTWFIVAMMYGQSQRKALLLGIGGAVLFQLLFSYVLDIQPPAGVFGGLLTH